MFLPIQNNNSVVSTEGEEMVKCETCGANLVEGAKFCSTCGAPVGKVVKEEFTVRSEDLVGKIKELLHEGDITRVIVKDETAIVD